MCHRMDYSYYSYLDALHPGGQVQPVVLRPRDSLSSASCELQAPPGHLCLTTSREQCPVAPIKRLKYSDFLAGYMNTGRLDMQHSCRFMGLLFKVMVPSVAKGYTFTSKQRKSTT